MPHVIAKSFILFLCVNNGDQIKDSEVFYLNCSKIVTKIKVLVLFNKALKVRLRIAMFPSKLFLYQNKAHVYRNGKYTAPNKIYSVKHPIED